MEAAAAAAAQAQPIQASELEGALGGTRQHQLRQQQQQPLRGRVGGAGAGGAADDHSLAYS